MLIQGLLACIEDPEDAQAFPTVRDRLCPLGNAVQEMLAFQAQGLLLGDVGNSLGLALGGDGNIVFPDDLVVVEQEFFGPGHRVVEDGHLAVADDDEFLVLEGMQPRDEDVGLDPRREFEVRRGHVGDLAVQVVSARRLDVIRFFAGQPEDHGDVVRGEGPEGVLLAADLAEVQAVGVDVVDPPQAARSGQLLQPHEDGMILQQVPDHERQPSFPRQLDQLLSLAVAQGERLFHVDVLAGQQRLPGQGKVGFRGRCDHDAPDVGIGQDVGVGEAGPGKGVLLFELGQHRLVGVAEPVQRSQLMEITDEVPAPRSCADHGDFRYLVLVHPMFSE